MINEVRFKELVRRELVAAKTVTAAYTLLATDTLLLVDATAGAITITVPLATEHPTRSFIIKKIDASANAVTPTRSGADTIDGATSLTLSAQYDAVEIESDGSAWYVVTDNRYVAPTDGFKDTVDGWYYDNLGTGTAETEMTRANGRWRAVIAGSVLGVVITATEARTAGTCTATVYKNTGLAGAAGATIGLTAVLDGTNTSRKATTQAKDTDTFAAGDELYVTIQSDGSWTPTTSDIRCAVLVEC